MAARVAIATCDPAPDFGDDALLLTRLLAAGADARIAAWDDPTQDWQTDDLVVIRSTWDYVPRLDEFLRWARSVPRLANPIGTVEWNTDKTYLRTLGQSGVAVVPTRWIAPGDDISLAPEWPEFVVKPSVSAAAVDTNRYGPGDDDRALAHIARLTAAGRTAMLQPYIGGVDAHGETALIYIDGVYSHAMRKGPLLALGKDALTPESYREQMAARVPSEREVEVAESVIGAVPGGRELLYARIDLVPSEDGSPILIEAELTEPALFLGYDSRAADTLTAAILKRVTR